MLRTSPDFSQVGSYRCLLTDTISGREIEESVNGGLNISQFLVSSEAKVDRNDIQQLFNRFPQAKITTAKPEDVLSLEVGGDIPRWILHKKNFHKIIRGDYLSILPVTAEVVPTLNCNFRCVQCSYAPPKKKLNAWIKGKKFSFNYSPMTHMSKENMQVILERLAQGGVTNTLFTGGGEPFMNPDVTIFGLQLAKKLGLRIGLYSNGSLLNQKLIDTILECEPVFFRISLYGSRETFSLYTRGKKETFDRVISNLGLLAQTKLELGSKTQLGLSYLLHPVTMNSAESLVNQLLVSLPDHQLNQFNFMRFTPAVNYFGKSQHPQDEMEQVFDYIGTVIKPKFAGTDLEIKLYHHRLRDLNGSKLYKQCRASGWYGEVGPGGDAYLCCEKLFDPKHQIGNLANSSLEDIFTGSAREQLINNLDCGKCPILCKPHELNKVFEEIERLRSQGLLSSASQWREDILSSNRRDDFFAGKLNDYES